MVNSSDTSMLLPIRFSFISNNVTDRWTQKIHHKNRIKDDRKKIEFTDLICAKYGKHLSQPGCLHSFVIGEYKTTHTHYFSFGNCKEIIRSNVKIGLRYIIIIHAPKNKRIICSKTKQSLLRVCLRSLFKATHPSRRPTKRFWNTKTHINLPVLRR